MSHIFISYARKDIDFAQKIVNALADNNLDTWIDWKSIPKGEDWEQEIYRGIEEADAFLFLISPDSVRSEMCNKEIAHAVKNGKRILPIVIRDTEQKSIDPEISKRNWIFFRDGQDNFNKAIEETHKTIHTDYEWVRFHTDLLVRALKWENREFENSLLLRGKDLQEAESMLVIKADIEPNPISLQRQLVLRSRQAVDTQRKRIIYVSIGISITMMVLAISAVLFGIQSQKQARISRAGELAAESTVTRERFFDQSLLLSVEAFHTYENNQTKTVLFENLQTHPEVLQYVSGNKGLVRSIAFNQDGKTLISGGNDGALLLWNMANSELSLPLTENRGPESTSSFYWIFSVDFSPDGNTIAIGYGNGTIALWDLKESKFAAVYNSEEEIHSVAFSPNGKFLAAGGSNRTLLLIDMAADQIVTLPSLGNNCNVNSVAFSPDGKTMASACGDSLYLWDVITNRSIKIFNSGDDIGYVDSVNFSPDGLTLATGGFLVKSEGGIEGMVILWNVASGEPIGKSLQGHDGRVNSVAFSPDGRILASGGDDGNVILWNVLTHQSIKVFKPFGIEAGSVYSLAFSPNGETLASGGGVWTKEGVIVIWDLSPHVSLNRFIYKPFDTEDEPVQSMAFSPDSKTLALGTLTGTIMLQDISTNQYLGQLFTGSTGPVIGIAFSLDGKIIMAASDNWLILWDSQNLEMLNRYHIHLGYRALFNPDASILATTEGDTIYLWKVINGELIGSPLYGQDLFTDLAFSPDGKTMVSVDRYNSILLWNIGRRKLQSKLFSPVQGGDGFAFDPSGNILASANGYEIYFWSIRSRKQIRAPLVGHSGIVSKIAFSQDGRILVSGGEDEIILWNVDTGQPIGQSLSEIKGMVRNLSFSPDGNILVASSKDNTPILWDMNPQSWVGKICQRVGRNFTQAEWGQYFPGEAYRVTCPQWPTGE